MTAETPAPPVVVGVDGTVTMPLAVAWAADYCGTKATPLRLVAAYREDPFEAELRAAGPPENSTNSYPLHAAKRDLDEAVAYARALDPTLPLETVALPGQEFESPSAAVAPSTATSAPPNRATCNGSSARRIDSSAAISTPSTTPSTSSMKRRRKGKRCWMRRAR